MSKPDDEDEINRSIKAWAAALPEQDLTAFEVALRVQRVSRLGRSNLAQHLPFKGVKPGDAEVLALLFESGPPYRLQPSKLAERCLITTGAMTGRTNRLEAAALVRRVSSPTDRRVMEIELTERGEALACSTVRAILGSAFTSAIADLGREEIAQLSHLLRTLEARLSS